MNHLLAIAIDNYQNVRKLNNSVGDADAIVQLLTSKYHFEAKNINRLYNLEAGENEIYNTLKRLAITLTAEDNLVVYFAGHGIYDEVTEEGFWLPVQAREDTEGDYISNDKIIRYIKAIKAKHIFIMADACFSGSLFAANRSETAKKLDNKASRWVLTSGRMEVVSDGEPGKNSPFCSSVLEFLDTEEGEPIAVSDLVQYVKKQTAKKTNNKQIPRGSALFIPQDKGGEFFFYPKIEAEKQNITSTHFKINNTELNILYSDITKIEAQVLVSSDDERISMKGGVSEAIKKVAGKSVFKEAQKQVPAKIGEVIVTDGGKSFAEYIFHCITIDYETGERVDAKVIEKLTEKCLQTTEELGLKTIVFPALATGAARADFEEVAKAMVDTIGHYLLKTNNLEKVTIALKGRRGVNTKAELYKFYQKSVGRAAVLNQLSDTYKNLLDLQSKITKDSDLYSLLPLIMDMKSELSKVEKILQSKTYKSVGKQSKEFKVLLSALTEKAFTLTETRPLLSGRVTGFAKTNQSVINTINNLSQISKNKIKL